VAQAEALADSTDWIKTSVELSDAGRVAAERSGPREAGQGSGIASARRCDRFFTRRKDDLAQRKHIWSENLARKEASDAGGNLADPPTGPRGRRDQAAAGRGRTIGPVKRPSRGRLNRFRAACRRVLRTLQESRPAWARLQCRRARGAVRELEANGQAARGRHRAAGRGVGGTRARHLAAAGDVAARAAFVVESLEQRFVQP